MAIVEKMVGEEVSLTRKENLNPDAVIGATEEQENEGQSDQQETLNEQEQNEGEESQEDLSSDQAEDNADNGEPTENKEESPDGLWDDVDIDSEGEGQEKIEGDIESDISKLAESLGFRASTIDELKEAITSRSQEQPTEVDEDYKQYREIVDNGGSVDKLATFQSKIGSLDSEIADYEKALNFASNLRGQSLDQKENWYLNNYLPRVKGLPQDEVATIKEEFAEGLSASMKIIQINNAIDDIHGKASNALDKATTRKQAGERALVRYRDTVKQNKVKAQAKIKEAINSYKDPDGLTKFEKPAKALASQVLNSAPTTITLPKKLADMFYTDGEFDPQKAISLVAGNKFNRHKFKHLEKKIKKESFREKQSFDGKTNLAKTTKQGSKSDPYAGGLA